MELPLTPVETRKLETAAIDDPAPEDDGIVRFPADGEVLIRSTDRAIDIDRAF